MFKGETLKDRGEKMKLSELPDELFKKISYEERDLELPVKEVVVTVLLERKEVLVIHKWKYSSKKDTPDLGKI